MIPHRARRRFGQNFLVDGAVIESILAAIAPRRDDPVIEIGPGLGALTRPLAARLDRLRLIEIDRDIVARLRAEFGEPAVVIHAGDALEFDFAAAGPSLRVVGNLPYNISTPILFHLAHHADAIRDVHVMLQREVVERMVAAPGSSSYSRLSVMLQYRFHMERVFDVPPEAFRPPPEVHSALVRMTPRRPLHPRARDEPLLARIVAAAFAQRRKTLRNTLRQLFTAAELTALGIDPGLRAQDLAVAEYTRMADYAAARAAGNAGGDAA